MRAPEDDREEAKQFVDHTLDQSRTRIPSTCFVNAGLRSSRGIPRRRRTVTGHPAQLVGAQLVGG